MMLSLFVGLEGLDLFFINIMMLVVMSVGKVIENGGSFQGIKFFLKFLGLNWIGRRNQEMKEEKFFYNCFLCEKICIIQYQLIMYICQYNIDIGGVDYLCSICGKLLSLVSFFDCYMLVYFGERFYKCIVCGQLFIINGNMYRYMKIYEKDFNSVIVIVFLFFLKCR